jgi:hypothetical protein
MVCLACDGGSGTLTLEDYVREFKLATDDADAKSDEVEQQYGFDPDARTPNAEFYRAESRVAYELADRLEGLKPPPELRTAHDEVIQVFRRLAVRFESGEDSDDVLEREFASACSALEAASAAEGSTVELCFTE